MKLPNYVHNNPAVMCATLSDQNVCNIINLKYSGKKHTAFAVYYSGSEEYCYMANSFKEAQEKVNSLILKLGLSIERIHYIPDNLI